MTDELTIIVPIFNEEESLTSFFAEMDKFLKVSPVATQILCVNDGSTDNSLDIIQDKSAKSKEYRIINLDRNYGLSSAVKAGIDHCTTSLVGYIDADLQTKPTDFMSYFEWFPEFDMVNGIRAKRQDNLVKRISSKVGN